MKARKVKKLGPAMPLADAARRIVRVRLDELEDLGAAAVIEPTSEALDDLRVAAERLRFALETLAPAVGAYAREAGARARKLQRDGFAERLSEALAEDPVPAS